MNQFDKVINRRGTNSLKWDVYEDKEVISLGSADMDFESAPCIRDALISKAEKAMFGYEGRSDEYFQSIIDWNKRKHDYEIKKAWISNAPGVLVGLRLCIDTFTASGDSILMHGPYFNPIVTLIVKSKRKFVSSPLRLQDGKYEMDFEAFEKKIIENNVRMFILVNPQNPTGKVYTREELARMGEICGRHGVVVVSDEVHSNVLYDNHVHYPYTAVSNENANHGIILTSVTKGFNLQGLTYGILIIPNPVYREMFEETIRSYDLDYATNIFSMAALVAAYNQGEGWLKELNEYLLGNLEYLTDFFEKDLPDVKVIRPEGSYLVWLDMRKLGLSPEELKKLFMEKAKVAFSFGEDFGKEGEGFERLNFACPRSVLKEALGRIKAAIDGI